MNDYLTNLPERLRTPGDHKSGEIEIISASDDEENIGLIYKDKYFTIVRDKVRFPNGGTGGYLRVINTQEVDDLSGTVMVPIWNDSIVFVNIFRHATRSWEWELPRGFQELNISVIENARNEIKEELGSDITELEKIGIITPNTGVLADRSSAFVVKLANWADTGDHGANEGIKRAKLVPFSDLPEFIANGPVTCGYSLAAILHAKLKGHLTL